MRKIFNNLVLIVSAKFVGALAALLLFQSCAEAAIINAASMAYPDVVAAVDLATNGDTVIVPPGAVCWTNAVLVSNAITLEFSGVGQSIITNCQTNNFAPSWYESMITFFTTNTLDPKGNPRFYRLTGLEMDGSVLPNNNPLVKGAIQIVGNGSNVRIDHCSTSNLYDDSIETYDAATGVADHNTFYLSGNQHAFEFQAAAWDGGIFADGSWEDTSHFGTSRFFYAEDCTFINISNLVSTAATDATAGARWVVRNCVISNMFLSNHGTESGGLTRGPRACEVYNNLFYADGVTVDPNVVTFRAATGVLFSNVAICRDKGFFNNFASLNEYRMTENYPSWGISDGTNLLDQNIGGPFATVTNIVAGKAASLTLTVADSSWTPNQWVGYSIWDISQPSGTTSANSTNFSVIVANTANTATFLSANLHPNLILAAGDVCQFWLISNALDMPGMGQSLGVRNASGAITNTVLNQVIDPIYSWSNTINGADMECKAVYPIMKEGIHFFNGVPKPGYTPYTYPHPLTMIGAISPPTGFRVIDSGM